MTSPRSFRLVHVPVGDLGGELDELAARGWTVARRSVDRVTGAAVVLISRPIPAELPAELEESAPVVKLPPPKAEDHAPPVAEIDLSPSVKPAKPKAPRKSRAKGKA